MAYSSIGNLPNGKFLQIVFSEGVRNQLSSDYRDWEQVQMIREGNPNGRQLNFLFQTGYGPGAVQYRNPNFTSSFPASQRMSTSEHTAVYKELNSTVMIEYNLWKMAQISPETYAEPLAIEIQSKTISLKKRLAADLYGDGTGVVGKVASIVDTAAHVTVTLDSANAFSGHVGFFEYDDLLLARTAAGAAQATAPDVVSGTFYAWRVKDKDRPNNRVVLEAVDESYNVLTLDTGGSGSGLAAGEFFYRVGQPTFPNRGTITDYGSATEVIPGLESLAAADSRLIYGITMGGSTAASKYDAGATAFDVTHIQNAMDQTKVRVGKSVYKWKKMCMAPENHAKLIDSRETDRRFVTREDAARGIKVFGYQHEEDFLESYTSEYIPLKRVWILPEKASGAGKVLEFHGTDFEPVRAPGGDEFHLLPGANGGHERRVISYMEGIGTLVCKHPAAIARIENFT